MEILFDPSFEAYVLDQRSPTHGPLVVLEVLEVVTAALYGGFPITLGLSHPGVTPEGRCSEEDEAGDGSCPVACRTA